MNVVVLTGAGISAESGVPTFRGSDGLWENHRIEEVATPEGFARNPALVQQFYNERRRALHKVQPNAAHTALASFQKRSADSDGSFLLVTQNIDDLHERGGSENVCHMHGELLSMFCQQCNEKHAVSGDISASMECSHCGEAGGLRPDIVWFGEMPYHMERIERALSHCQLFVSIGTSGNVYPAAGFVATARQWGARCVELNLEPSNNRDMFDEGHYGPATTIVQEFFSAL